MKHKKEGIYDGLYMPHDEAGHDAWLESKKNYTKSQCGKRGKDCSNKGGTTTLTLTKNMRAAMCVDTGMSCQNFDTMIRSYQLGNN